MGTDTPDFFESLEQYRQTIFEKLDPLIQQVAKGVEFLGDTALQIGESAVRGVGAIASMLGLGGLIPTSSSGSAIASDRGRDTLSTPIASNFPVKAAEPLVSTDVAIERAMKNTIEPMSKSLRELVDNERILLSEYNGGKLADANLTAVNAPMPTAGISRSTGVGGLGTA